MVDANVSSADFSWPFIEKLEVTRWAAFTLWVVFFVLGVPGNILILCVCRIKSVRTTTHVFIGALAMADLLTCVLKFADAIVLASVSHYLEYDNQNVVYFLSTGLLYTTAFLTMSIAFDRYDAVCRSLRRTMTLRRAKCAAATCYAAGFIGILPEAGHKIHVDLNDGEVDTFIRSVFKFIPVSLYIVSFLVVTVLYCVIFVFIRKRRQVLSLDILTQQHSVSAIGNVSYHQADILTGNCQENKTRTMRNVKAGSSINVVATAAVGCAWATASNNQQTCAPAASSTSAGRSDVKQTPDIARTHSQVPSVNRSACARARPSEYKKRPDRPCEGASSGPSPPVRRRQRQTNSRSRMTKMLFSATFMFFILWFPNVYVKCYALGGLFVDFLKSSHHANVVAALLVLKDVVYFNSVINALIYGLANKRFRDESRKVIQTVRQRFKF